MLVKVVFPLSAVIFCELFDEFTDVFVREAVSSEILFGLLKSLAVTSVALLARVVLVLAVVVLAVVVLCSRGPVKRAHCSDVLSDGRHKLKKYKTWYKMTVRDAKAVFYK